MSAQTNLKKAMSDNGWTLVGSFERGSVLGKLTGMGVTRPSALHMSTVSGDNIQGGTDGQGNSVRATEAPDSPNHVIVWRRAN